MTCWRNAPHVLHIDIETYCEVDIAKSGVYPYAASPSFEVLLIGYALDDGPVCVLDLTKEGPEAEAIKDLHAMMANPDVLKVAHNAAFEMACLASVGFAVNPEQWGDTMALANYAGLPASLAALTDVLSLGEKGKLSVGKQLVTYFCKPCKPTKANKGRTRNRPEDDPEAWEVFMEYNRRDVEAEREVFKRLIRYDQPENEHEIMLLDGDINRRGIHIDTDLARAAVQMSGVITDAAVAELKQITGLSNPNSVPQFKQFLEAEGFATEKFTKDVAEEFLSKTDLPLKVRRAIELKLLISKAAVKKYDAMLRALCPDGTVKGAFQYYGSHTGRWAGRLVQLQNLRRNSLPDLDIARQLVKRGDLEGLRLGYDESESEILGQLVRTAFVPSCGHKFIVADFSAIEARVVAWLARESWREEVFAKDGDIYKSSYSQAFGVPVSDITKDQRQKGKIMELALGYGGAVSAMQRFGADKLGLSEEELADLVKRWRATSPRIPLLWKKLERAAIAAALKGKSTEIDRGVVVGREDSSVVIRLPSGRRMYYAHASVEESDMGNGEDQLTYYDINQLTRNWSKTRTYGGKLTENVVQALARDCLAYAMLRLSKAGYKIVSHIHDEVIVDAPIGAKVSDVEDIMGQNEAWAEGLHLTAKGYEGPYYFKD